MTWETAALIVAAGRGARAGGDVPKQFVRLGGIPVIARAVDAFGAIPVVVVVGDGQHEMLTHALGAREIAGIVTGGETRQASVRNGLAAIAAAGGAANVLVHDAARPNLPRKVLTALVDALATHDGAVPALPVADTLARGEAGFSAATRLGEIVPRDALYRVQTPQAFRFDALLAAHDAWTGEAATDDAQMLRSNGGQIALIAGDTMLDKITEPQDFARAEAMLAARTLSRSAMGYDVHRLELGEELWLGGIRIDHSHGLSGHSDADVALHAITDALLGTIAAGDIGSFFPPSDPRWRGAASHRFVDHARAMIAQAGGIIDFVDLTLICEAPKIGPHRLAMQMRIAEILQVSSRRISVKATTTERLGFTGRGEGIAAQAIATVRVPEDM